MTNLNLNEYKTIRGNGFGYKEMQRGLIEVSGREAVQFLNGLVTNDVAKLEDGTQMSAAFPNAQGRLLALVRILRRGDTFLFETEQATSEKVFQNLFRFTYAGDFFVSNLSEKYVYFSLLGKNIPQITDETFIVLPCKSGVDCFVPKEKAESFKSNLGGAIEISDDLYEVLRIENGKPLYGVDMDETTIVLETGLDEAVSFSKGCYIGQEIIARIHFRGHVAKRLNGLIFEDENAPVNPNDEIKSADGKNAGRLTSVTYSPTIGKVIALAYVRYDYLAEGTPLKIDGFAATAKDLPFVE